MTNPFSLEPDAVVNFATGVVLPDDVAETLVNSSKKGRDQMNNCIEKRINSNTTSSGMVFHVIRCNHSVVCQHFCESNGGEADYTQR